MAEINTRIVLRHDESADWTSAGEKATLKAGEAAIEFVNGKAKMKVGTSEGQKFADAPYIGGAEANVFQVELAADATDIEAAIEAVIPEGTELAVGDIAIVKAGIAGDKKSYTSYVYDGTNWAATDGNYSAANVYTNSAITLAGDYGKDSSNHTISSIGNKRIGDTIAAGTSLQALLMDILTKRIQPSATAPSAGIVLTNDNSNGANVEVEIGTTYTPKYKTSFSSGKFTNGPATGVTSTAATITFGTSSSKVSGVTADIAANSLNGATGTLPGYVVPDGTKRYLYLTYGWTASTSTPVDNLGDVATNADEIKIAAASGKSATSSHGITGIRKMFGGSSVSEPSLVSNTIRNLASNKKSGTGTFDVTIAEGANYAIIAVPAGRTVTKVEDGNAFGTDIFSEFNTPVTVSVGGADATADSVGSYATNYNVYVYAPSASLSANTYTVHVA